MLQSGGLLHIVLHNPSDKMTSYVSDGSDTEVQGHSCDLKYCQEVEHLLGNLLKHAVVRQPWSCTSADSQVTLSHQHLSRTSCWKRNCRDLEWQCRWLEIRLHELKEQEVRLRSLADQLKRNPEQFSQTEAVELDAAKRLFTSYETSATAPLPALCTSDPAFVYPCEARPGPRFSNPSTEGSSLPASMYCAVELLDQQVLNLRQGLQTAFKLDSSAAPPCRTGDANLRPQSSLSKRWSRGRGLSIITRQESVGGSLKRRRSELDGDAITPGLALSGAKLERQQSIHVPPVREIPEADMVAMQTAIAAWKACMESTDAAPLQPLPAEVEAILLKLNESGSSEDTSDEAFEKRHAAYQKDEHERYQGFTGGARKKNKISVGKGQQGMKTPRALVSADVPSLVGLGGSDADPAAIPALPSGVPSGQGSFVPQPDSSEKSVRTGRPSRGGRPPGRGRGRGAGRVSVHSRNNGTGRGPGRPGRPRGGRTSNVTSANQLVPTDKHLETLSSSTPQTSPVFANPM